VNGCLALDAASPSDSFNLDDTLLMIRGYHALRDLHTHPHFGVHRERDRVPQIQLGLYYLLSILHSFATIPRSFLACVHIRGRSGHFFGMHLHRRQLPAALLIISGYSCGAEIARYFRGSRVSSERERDSLDCLLFVIFLCRYAPSHENYVRTNGEPIYKVSAVLSPFDFLCLEFHFVVRPRCCICDQSVLRPVPKQFDVSTCKVGIVASLLQLTYS
jgi:hypothetical protein